MERPVTLKAVKGMAYVCTIVLATSFVKRSSLWRAGQAHSTAPGSAHKHPVLQPPPVAHFTSLHKDVLLSVAASQEWPYLLDRCCHRGSAGARCHAAARRHGTGGCHPLSQPPPHCTREGRPASTPACANASVTSSLFCSVNLSHQGNTMQPNMQHSASISTFCSPY